MGTPPPLPRIDVGLVLASLAAHLGDPAFARDLKRAILDNAEQDIRKAAASIRLSHIRPNEPFAGATMEPGSPANPLSEEQAAALFADLAGLIYYIPFDYPQEGCFARAHEMCRVLQERGIVSGKVWNYEGDEPLVVMRTPFGIQTWDYHVAPIVSVRDADGQIKKMVFDPSIAREPLTIDRWRAAQGGPAGQHMAETDATPFHYKPDDFASGDRIGVVREDPTHEITRASLPYFAIQRDLEAAGL